MRWIARIQKVSFHQVSFELLSLLCCLIIFFTECSGGCLVGRLNCALEIKSSFVLKVYNSQNTLTLIFIEGGGSGGNCAKRRKY